ncbi:hypothetical protein PMIN07_011369 [Paraphaeosphaeria minitans]
MNKDADDEEQSEHVDDDVVDQAQYDKNHRCGFAGSGQAMLSTLFAWIVGLKIWVSRRTRIAMRRQSRCLRVLIGGTCWGNCAWAAPLRRRVGAWVVSEGMSRLMRAAASSLDRAPVSLIVFHGENATLPEFATPGSSLSPRSFALPQMAQSL